jgi:hypothetical protein
MADKAGTDWLEVIGRTLSYLCLEHAKKEDPDKFKSVQKKVDFLIDMGLPKDVAAYVAGSNPKSVAVMASQKKSGGKSAKKKKR